MWFKQARSGAGNRSISAASDLGRITHGAADEETRAGGGPNASVSLAELLDWSHMFELLQPARDNPNTVNQALDMRPEI